MPARQAPRSCACSPIRLASRGVMCGMVVKPRVRWISAASHSESRRSRASGLELMSTASTVPAAAMARQASTMRSVLVPLGGSIWTTRTNSPRSSFAAR